MNASPSTHPSEAALRAYGLGKLDDVLTATVESHLEECPDCRRRVSSLPGDSFVERMRAAGTETEPTIPDPESAPIATTTPSALPAELAQQYELIRVLGRGGMGVVYLARNRLMDRLEALKILNREMLERRGTLDRFLREIRVVAQLNHENVVRAYSALQLGTSLVFVLEYVEGMDLAKLIKDRGPLPVPHACYFAQQAALGLQHAHERGMVHRDIKPGNLILHKEGQRAIIKVLDFGLAKALSEQSDDTSLTREGQMLGTPDYIAPEQTLDAQKADIRADIYSLGCTLYFLLSGAPPFQGTSLYDILQAHHSMDAHPLNLRRPEVPLELAALVAKMMAKDPGRRFQTPGEVAKALTPFFKKSASALTATAPAPVAPRPAVEVGPMPVGSPVPAITPPPLPDPGTQWRSLIGARRPEPAPVMQATLAPPSGGRGRWRRWIAAAAAGVAAVALGVTIFIEFRKSRDGTVVRAGVKITPEPKPPSITAAPARSKPAVEPAPAAPRAVDAEPRPVPRTTYKVFPDQVDWHTARKRCEEMGGKLAILKTAEQNQRVAQLAAEADVPYVWLGASDEAQEGRWVWVDGTPMSYAVWDREGGEPNNRSPQGEGEHYLVMDVAKQVWRDQPALGQVGRRPGYVCQWEGESARSSNDGPTPRFNALAPQPSR